MSAKFIVFLAAVLVGAAAFGADKEVLFPEPVDIRPKPVASDPSVKLDYDIVYVRAPRHGDRTRSDGDRRGPGIRCPTPQSGQCSR